MSNRIAVEKVGDVSSLGIAQPKKTGEVSRITKSIGFWVFNLTFIGIFTLALYAHLKVSKVGDTYVGWLMPFALFFNLVFTVIVLAIIYAVGRKVTGYFSTVFISVAEEISFSTMLGLGIVGLVLFVFGIWGLFRLTPLILLLSGLAIFSYKEFGRLIIMSKGILRACRSIPGILIALGLGSIVILLAVKSSTPPYAVDDAICHLAVPQEYIKAGKIIPLFDNFPSNMPLLVHMFYAVFIAAKADIAARFFSLGLAVITGIAVYAFGLRFLNRLVATLAIFIFFSAGVVLEVAISNRIDVTVAGMMFLASYAMVNYFESNRIQWLWQSALFSGFSLSIKYTAAIWIASLGVMFLYEGLVRKREPLLNWVKNGAFFTLIMCAAVSPWLIKNAVYFKNPLYPFITGEVADYGAQGIRYFTAPDEKRMDDYFIQSKQEVGEEFDYIEKTMTRRATKREERHPLRVWEHFTKPELYSMGDAEKSHSPNYFFMLLPLFFLVPKPRWLIWLGLFSIVFFLFVASSAWLGRYLVPMYPALTVIIAHTIVALAQRWRLLNRLKMVLPIAVVIIGWLFAMYAFASQLNQLHEIDFIVGRLSRKDFLSPMYYYPAMDYINNYTPTDAKVMLMGVQTGYHLQRDYIADPAWDSVEWQRLMIRNNSMAEIYEDVKQQGITHVLFHPGLFNFIAEYGRAGSGPSGEMYSAQRNKKGEKDYDVQLRNYATFELFSSKYLENVQTFKTGNIEFRILKLK
ncbi:MAG: glycosyltransferase family 39 protein [Acidobacteriota bacterium]